jgi:hypothetical protein
MGFAAPTLGYMMARAKKLPLVVPAFRMWNTTESRTPPSRTFDTESTRAKNRGAPIPVPLKITSARGVYVELLRIITLPVSGPSNVGVYVTNIFTESPAGIVTLVGLTAKSAFVAVSELRTSDVPRWLRATRLSRFVPYTGVVGNVMLDFVNTKSNACITMFRVTVSAKRSVIVSV